jgi:hypothetical protein
MYPQTPHDECLSLLHRLQDYVSDGYTQRFENKDELIGQLENFIRRFNQFHYSQYDQTREGLIRFLSNARENITRSYTYLSELPLLDLIDCNWSALTDPGTEVTYHRQASA